MTLWLMHSSMLYPISFNWILIYAGYYSIPYDLAVLLPVLSILTDALLLIPHFTMDKQNASTREYMADRAEMLGGQLRLSSAKGGGTELEWKVPVPAEEPAAADEGLRPEPQGKYPLH